MRRPFMKLLVVVVLATINSCAAVRPVDVCVDLPKTSADAGAAKVTEAGPTNASDAKGD
jgi:hypothetical protein